MSIEPPPDQKPSVAYPAVLAFCVALATLLLQLVQTRIYGIVFWNHLVYFIISIALLGFGISGTWLAFGKDTRIARMLTVRNSAIAFMITTFVACLLAPQWAISIASVVSGAPRMLQLLLTYSVAILPYFFGGWILGSIFRDYVERIHLLYFWDLMGAGLGCLLFLWALQPFGAIYLVLFTCAIVVLPPLIQDSRRRSTQILLLATVVLLVGLATQREALNRSIQPEDTKAFHALYQDLEPGEETVWDMSEWNGISRIDVVNRVKPGTGSSETKNWRAIFIDGDAWTGIVSQQWWRDDYNPDGRHLLGPAAPFWFFSPDTLDDVLVVGSGGGADVALALWGGADEVDAVEINPTTHRIMLEEYREISHDLMHQPGVEAFNEEGRSFISRSDEKYDVITMTGIDTFAAINSGAYVLSENYLYTIEAIMDYIEHLTPDGMLNITRWLHEAETTRLFIVCYEALAAMGVEEPGRHILLQGKDRATINVRPTPFTETEIREYGDFLAKNEGRMFYPPHPEHKTLPYIREYVEQRRDGLHKQYLAMLSINVAPVTDDSPFFFHFDKPQNFLNVFRERSVVDFVRGHWPSFTLFSLLAFTIVAVVVFMLLPLARRGRPAIPGFGRWLIFFTCLGVSFIFVEIALMQRFALLLGHPSRSLALVLASLLIAAGIGSQARGMLKIDLRLSLLLLVVVVLLAAYVYPTIVEAALGWSLFARGVLTVALVFVPGFFMGMPFPSGMLAVSKHGSSAVPWMWGINGGTTVLGSILAIIIAIWGSFTLVLVTAAVGYLLALFMFSSASKKGAV